MLELFKIQLAPGNVRGRRITGQPLNERRKRLIDLVGRLGHPLLIVPDYVVGHGIIPDDNPLSLFALPSDLHLGLSARRKELVDRIAQQYTVRTRM